MGRDYQHIYCLFCRTGAEKRICGEISKRFPQLHPLAAIQEKHRIVNKQEEIDRRVFLPGYLFVYSNEKTDLNALLRMDDVFRILGEEENVYELQGGDRAFAQWLEQNGGVIGISRIRIANNKLLILSGPMKYFAKKLIRLDKHTRNALVRLDFLGTVREIWLAFEFDDEEILDDKAITEVGEGNNDEK